MILMNSSQSSIWTFGLPFAVLISLLRNTDSFSIVRVSLLFLQRSISSEKSQLQDYEGLKMKIGIALRTDKYRYAGKGKS